MVALTGVAHDTGNGCQIDDAAFLGTEHHAADMADHMEGALEIGVQHRIKGSLAHHGNQAVPGDAGAVDQQLNAAK